MNKPVSVNLNLPEKRLPAPSPPTLRTAEQARAIYLRSARRLDLARLVQVFSTAPDAAECSGADSR